MALYYAQTADLTGVMDAAIDPSKSMFPWLSYQLTDWAAKVGPSYAKIRVNHDVWAEKSSAYTSTSQMFLQVDLRGTNWRAGNDANEEPHGYQWFGYQGSTSYYYEYSAVYNESSYDSGSSNTSPHFNLSRSYLTRDLRNIMRPIDFNAKRLAACMYSDTPGQRFFAWNLFGYTGCLHEMTEIADGPSSLDSGWLYGYSDQFWEVTRFSPGSTDQYYPVITEVFDTGCDQVGYSESTNFRPMMDKFHVRNMYGQYRGMTDGTVGWVQNSVPLFWQWTFEDKTYVSWDSQMLINVTGLV